MNIFLTGGLGFAGQYLVYGLLKKGYNVILLGRSKDGNSLEGRKSVLIKNNQLVNPEFQIDKKLFRNLTLLEGDLSQQNFGLSKKDNEILENTQIDEIYNAAAILRYESKHRALCQQINVEGTRMLLDLAVEKKSRYIQISTAFITGSKNGNETLVEEKFYNSNSFPNVYIESKAQAEELVKKCGEENNIDYLIFRLPGLLGDSKTGFSNSIFGFYEYMGALAALQSRVKKDEKVIRFCAPPTGAANILPTDIAAQCILTICERKDFPNPIFNITDSHPLSPSYLAETLGKLYKLPMQPIEKREQLTDETRIEKLFSRLTRQNAVLVNHCYNFDSKNAEKYLGHEVSYNWDKSIQYFALVKKGYENYVLNK
ncbi:SDR family oxidoreductase [Maribellus maritimus]|uniref:SDR family oxidoreductase n=1 Tax=Maribellus maritimus TaxID=2870838 RepID=UPI001EEBB1E1|nr:SDR family oxidoreductase [Maribellus maritimus]MCG6186691.1 SDR family oxidoreductase [Maribellus maritimus]